MEMKTFRSCFSVIGALDGLAWEYGGHHKEIALAMRSDYPQRRGPCNSGSTINSPTQTSGIFNIADANDATSNRCIVDVQLIGVPGKPGVAHYDTLPLMGVLPMSFLLPLGCQISGPA